MLAAVAVLALTTIWAAEALPDHVDLYYNVSSRPDDAVDRWTYLLLVTLSGAVLAVGTAIVVRGAASLAAAFTWAPIEVPGVMGWTAAWTLLWASAEMWLAIWLGNSEPVRRSWLELLLAIAWLLGVVAVLCWRVAVAASGPGRRR